MEVLLEFVGDAGLASGSKRGNLPPSVLPELNARLSDPIELHLRRPLLKDYPNIAGLYILLRVMELIRVNGSRIRTDAERLDSWNRLNAHEKYFALMEAWLIHGDENVLGGAQGQRESWQFQGNLNFLARDLSSARWKTFPESVHTYAGFLPGISAANAQLQARFGLIELGARGCEGRETWVRGWIMLKAKRTSWGEAVAWAILKYMGKQQEKVLFFRMPEDADFGFLHPVFRPYFPEWKTIYSRHEIDFCPCSYHFKVTLRAHTASENVWRRLTAPGSATLADLAEAVLAAFNIGDTDHAYELQFQDPRGRMRVFYPSFMAEGPYAHEILLGETGLAPKQTVNFLFDFGPRQQFVLKLERMDPAQPDKPDLQRKEKGAAGEMDP